MKPKQEHRQPLFEAGCFGPGQACWQAGSEGRRCLYGRLGAAERKQEGQKEQMKFEEEAMRKGQVLPPSLDHLPSAYPFPNWTNILHPPPLSPLSCGAVPALCCSPCMYLCAPWAGWMRATRLWRRIEAFLFLLPARQWAASPWPGSKRKSKGLHP